MKMLRKKILIPTFISASTETCISVQLEEDEISVAAQPFAEASLCGSALCFRAGVGAVALPERLWRRMCSSLCGGVIICAASLAEKSSH